MTSTTSSSRRHRRTIKAITATTITLLGVVPALVLSANPASADAPQCGPNANGTLRITETCVDPALTQPTVDIDEQRTMTDPTSKVTVSYRYVHGYFADHPTAKFAFYFPAASAYVGRFFEDTYPLVSTEDAAPNDVAFALTHGAYAVTTNNDGGVPVSQALGGYRVNAAAAKYSRTVAATVYGAIARPRGYLYGASGGAYQTLGGAENTDGVWDGAAPAVPGVPNAIPSFAAVAILALRVLNDKLPKIADSLEPGGSGKPYAGLSDEQQAVLLEATKMGLPLRALWQYKTLLGSRNAGELAVVGASLSSLDPTYVSDFWTVPGYEGSDKASVKKARAVYDTAITSVKGNVVTVSKASGPLLGATLTIKSGAATGKSAVVTEVAGKKLTLEADAALLAQLSAGTAIGLDNSIVIAMEYYPRHQVPTSDQYGWNQYRDDSGYPTEIQRPMLVGPVLADFSGGVATGNFHGKMIMLASAMDAQAYPWSADWYRKQAAKAGLTSNYRLWVSDNADHEPVNKGLDPDHVVPYMGEWQQAVLDLDTWVTTGKAPAATTNYSVKNSQITVLGNAKTRGGIQPLVSLAVHTKAKPKLTDSITVKKGTKVLLSAAAQTPASSGKIVRVEWDFTDSQKFKAKPTKVSAKVTANATHVFTKKGTYFVTVRVTAERAGSTKAPFTRVQNLDRVRVVVR